MGDQRKRKLPKQSHSPAVQRFVAARAISTRSRQLLKCRSRFLPWVRKGLKENLDGDPWQ